jgi:CrcB protein
MPGGIAITLAVAAGGALGAVARYLVSLALLEALGPGFPWGTLVVNAAGSFLIGLYVAITGPGGRFRTGPVRSGFVVTGFCGGFTTFSIFSLDALLMLEAGDAKLAGLYVAASLLLWLAAVWAGYRTGRGLGAG